MAKKSPTKTSQKMTRMTINLPEAEYRKIVNAAATLGISIDKYARTLLTKKEQKNLVKDGEVVRVLSKRTAAALRESRNNRSKLVSYNTVKEMMDDLKS